MGGVRGEGADIPAARSSRTPVPGGLLAASAAAARHIRDAASNRRPPPAVQPGRCSRISGTPVSFDAATAAAEIVAEKGWVASMSRWKPRPQIFGEPASAVAADCGRARWEGRVGVRPASEVVTSTPRPDERLGESARLSRAAEDQNAHPRTLGRCAGSWSSASEPATPNT